MNPNLTKVVSEAAEKVQYMPEFKRAKHIDVVTAIQSNDPRVPLKYLMKQAEAKRSPLRMKLPLLNKAASGVITNTVAGTLAPVMRTPTSTYDDYRESLVFTALETIPATGNYSAFTKIKSVEEAEVQTNEGDALTVKGGEWEAQSIKLDTVNYLTTLSKQYLDDETSLDLFTKMIKVKVSKLCANKALESFKAIKEPVTVTETNILDKFNEALKSLPSELEPRLIVINKADAMLVDKALMQLGIVPTEESKTLYGVPVLVSDVADANESLIITNSAVVIYDTDSYLEYGYKMDDFTKNLQSVRLLQRVKGAALTDGAVYSVILQ